MGTENVRSRPQGAEKKGFEVGNPKFKNTIKLTFPQGLIHSDEVRLGLGRVRWLGYSLKNICFNLT